MIIVNLYEEINHDTYPKTSTVMVDYGYNVDTGEIVIMNQCPFSSIQHLCYLDETLQEWCLLDDSNLS